MGPRPFGRGRRQGAPVAYAGHAASMGPRPFGRGRRALGTRLRIQVRRVNGAATVWPRKVDVPTDSPPIWIGVNGAATVWPRKVLKQNRLLQCIISVNGAATVWPRKDHGAECHKHKVQASMGPRPFGRGRLKQGSETIGHRPRQWGRDRLAAEGGRVAQVRRGARRRQWGRDRLAAEGGQPANFSGFVSDASMGPRPFGRGRISTTTAGTG